MGDVTYPIFEPPAGQEVNYITLTAPAANLGTGSTEEIEIETGISVSQLEVLRILGLQIQNFANIVMEDFDGGENSAESRDVQAHLQTRTGDFNVSDPEYVTGIVNSARAMSDGTQLIGVVQQSELALVPEGGELVGTPRLIFETQNNMGGTTISADTFDVRIGYEFESLDRDKFLELIEKHADVSIFS